MQYVVRTLRLCLQNPTCSSCSNAVTSTRSPGASGLVLVPSSPDPLTPLVFSPGASVSCLPCGQLHFSSFCGDAFKAFMPRTLLLFHIYCSSRAVYVFTFLFLDRMESLCRTRQLHHHTGSAWAGKDKTLRLYSGPYILFLKIALWSLPFKCSRLKLNSFICIMIICFHMFLYQQDTQKQGS